VSQEYKWIIEQQLGNPPLQDNDDIEQRWKNINQSKKTAAEEVFGMSQPKRRNGWFDVESQKAVNIRNEARKKMIQRETRANTLEYTNARKEVKLICRRKKISFKRYKKDIREMKREYFMKVSVILKRIFNQELPFVGIRTGT
jgi:hypothetical protein